MEKNNSAKETIWLLLILGIVLLPMVASAGFGSSYLPKINDTDTAEIPIGSNFSYFVYPQNLENKTLIIQINFTKGQELIKNQLAETYEISPNVESDEFPIEVIFGISDDQLLIGKQYEIEYAIHSKFKDTQTSSGVAFSPIGYTKQFVISVINKTKIITPNITQNNTQNTTTPTTQQETTTSSSTTRKAIIKTTTKSQNITAPQTPQEPNEIPQQENPIPESPIVEGNTEIIENGITLSDTSNIKTYLIGIIVLGIIFGVSLIFIKNHKKKSINKYFNQPKENEQNNTEVEEIDI